MLASNRGQAQENSEARHISQWKPVRNQQAIERYSPGARFFSEPTCARERLACSRSARALKVHARSRLNPSHFHCLASRFVSEQDDLAAERQEKEAEGGSKWPEKDISDEAEDEACSQAICGAAGARGSDGSRDPAALLLLLTFAPIRCPYS